MRAFITGIGGFVGSYLAKDLTGEGFEVHGMVEKEGGHLGVISDCKVKTVLHTCDISDSQRLTRILCEIVPDLIFHLASVSFLPQAALEADRTFQVNLLGTLNLYEAVRKNGLSSRILFVGSAQEYGLTFNERSSVNEDCPLKPVDPYSTSKAAADLLSFQYCYGVGLPIVRVRPFNHSGPGQSEQFVCSSFAKQIAEIELGRKRPLLHVGNLEVRRDFLDVRDIVRAYRLALIKGKVGEVYNVCSERSLSIREILDIFLSFSEMRIKVVQDPARKRNLEIPKIVGECKKFKADTGWQSAIPLEQTLRDLLNRWRQVLNGSSDFQP